MTYEAFNSTNEEYIGQKFFTGHGPGEKSSAKSKIENDINTAIEKMKSDPNKYLNVNSEKIKNTLLNKAKDNNWKGKIIWGQDAHSGKYFAVYKNGESGFNAVASGAASGTEVMGGF